MKNSDTNPHNSEGYHAKPKKKKKKRHQRREVEKLGNESQAQDRKTWSPRGARTGFAARARHLSLRESNKVLPSTKAPRFLPRRRTATGRKERRSKIGDTIVGGGCRSAGARGRIGEDSGGYDDDRTRWQWDLFRFHYVAYEKTT
jgi:hypothetical protein